MAELDEHEELLLAFEFCMLFILNSAFQAPDVYKLSIRLNFIVFIVFISCGFITRSPSSRL